MKRQQGQLRQYLTLVGYCTMLLLASCQGTRSSQNVVQTYGQQQTKKITTSGVYHEVKAGQTLWSIARAYDIEVSTLAQINQLADTANISVGQQLFIPGAKQLREAGRRCPCGPATPSTPPPAAKSISLFSRSAKQGSIQQDTALGRLAFIWPLQASVSRSFEQSATKRHDGIDLSAPQGTPIRAAAHGEVMFSGWGPGGYGKTVILQHQADLVTIYAHNHDNLVQVGQHVRQGEPIATVGQSGRATGSHVHFEVRHKATPISPYTLLPHRSDNVAELIR